MNASEWASWVQAVGSIAAIVASVMLGRFTAVRDLENLQQHARDEQNQTRRYIVEMVEYATDKVREIKRWAENDAIESNSFWFQYHPAILDNQIGLLNAMSINALGSAAAATSLISAKDRLQYVKASIERWDDLRRLAGGAYPDDPAFLSKVNVGVLEGYIGAMEQDTRTMRAAILALENGATGHPKKSWFNRMLGR